MHRPLGADMEVGPPLPGAKAPGYSNSAPAGRGRPCVAAPTLASAGVAPARSESFRRWSAGQACAAQKGTHWCPAARPRSPTWTQHCGQPLLDRRVDVHERLDGDPLHPLAQQVAQDSRFPSSDSPASRRQRREPRSQAVQTCGTARRSPAGPASAREEAEKRLLHHRRRSADSSGVHDPVGSPARDAPSALVPDDRRQRFHSPASVFRR